MEAPKSVASSHLRSDLRGLKRATQQSLYVLFNIDTAGATKLVSLGKAFENDDDDAINEHKKFKCTISLSPIIVDLTVPGRSSKPPILPTQTRGLYLRWKTGLWSSLANAIIFALCIT